MQIHENYADSRSKSPRRKTKAFVVACHFPLVMELDSPEMENAGGDWSKALVRKCMGYRVADRVVN